MADFQDHHILLSVSSTGYVRVIPRPNAFVAPAGTDFWGILIEAIV